MGSPIEVETFIYFIYLRPFDIRESIYVVNNRKNNFNIR
jgi:hypothetical protein